MEAANGFAERISHEPTQTTLEAAPPSLNLLATEVEAQVDVMMSNFFDQQAREVASASDADNPLIEADVEAFISILPPLDSGTMQYGSMGWNLDDLMEYALTDQAVTDSNSG